jgi:hypothetical protein
VTTGRRYDAPPGSRWGLRLAAVPLLAAVTIITGGCKADDPRFALEESAKAEFARLCGAIGIALGAIDLQCQRR